MLRYSLRTVHDACRGTTGTLPHLALLGSCMMHTDRACDDFGNCSSCYDQPSVLAVSAFDRDFGCVNVLFDVFVDLLLCDFLSANLLADFL
jgi:hypothetical protein